MWIPSGSRRPGRRKRLSVLALALLIALALLALPVQASNITPEFRNNTNNASSTTLTCTMQANQYDVIYVASSSTQSVSTVADGGDAFASQTSASLATGTIPAYASVYSATVGSTGLKTVTITYSLAAYGAAVCYDATGFAATKTAASTGTGTYSAGSTFATSVASYTPPATYLDLAANAGSVCNGASTFNQPTVPAGYSWNIGLYNNGNTQVDVNTGTSCGSGNWYLFGSAIYNANAAGGATTDTVSGLGGASAPSSGSANWAEAAAYFAPPATTDSLAKAATVNFVKYVYTGDQVPNSDTVNFGAASFGGDRVTRTAPLTVGQYLFSAAQEILYPAFSTSNPSSNFYPVGFCLNSTAKAFSTCGVFVQFTPRPGTTQQSVGITYANLFTGGSNCATSTPPSVAGDSLVHQLTTPVNCQLTFTLPNGWAWFGTVSNIFVTVSSNALIQAQYYALGSGVSLSVNNPSQPLGGSAVLTANALVTIPSGYQLQIFDITNSTTMPLFICSVNPCVQHVASNHAGAQTFQAAITNNNALSGAVAASNTVTVTWGGGGGNLCVYYSLAGGGTFNPPAMAYTLNGAPKTITLTFVQQCVTFDTGTTWTVSPQPTLAGTGATSTERAYSQNATWSGTTSGHFHWLYWNQFYAAVSYTLADANNNNPTFNGKQFGSAYPQTLTRTPTPYWLDAGSVWTATNPFTSTPDLKVWYASPGGGVVTSANPIVVAYGAKNACTGPWQSQLLSGCFWAGMGPYITIFGLQGFIGLVMLGVDGAIWIQTKNGWIVVIVMSATAVLFGGALPQLFFLFALVLTGLSVGGLFLRLFWRRV